VVTVLVEIPLSPGHRLYEDTSEHLPKIIESKAQSYAEELSSELESQYPDVNLRVYFTNTDCKHFVRLEEEGSAESIRSDVYEIMNDVLRGSCPACPNENTFWGEDLEDVGNTSR
jgi:hypothetical protein